MLYACYDLLRPDTILEMSWRNGLHDFTMVCISLIISHNISDIATAIHDQPHRATDSLYRDAEEGQRRAQDPRSLAAEEGGGHSYSRFPSYAHSRPDRLRPLPRSIWTGEWHRATANWRFPSVLRICPVGRMIALECRAD